MKHMVQTNSLIFRISSMSPLQYYVVWSSIVLAELNKVMEAWKELYVVFGKG